MEQPAQTLLISFGSNIGDRVETCRTAIERIGRHPRIDVVRISSFYQTQPVGFRDQNWFINGVVACMTQLTPRQGLRFLQEVEMEFGRLRGKRWGPRTLDLDILAYAHKIINTEELIVPHPRLHERRFVLVPLVEIEPHWRHPILKRTALELLNDLPTCDQAVQLWRDP